jgi:phosphatidylserine/phosphatidylglycerophosphate/cardiolipin synthase-like enzyme
MASPSDRIAITPAERRAAVIHVIGSARSRLLMSLFRCDDFTVIDALADALSRGVRVEVLMTDRARGGRKDRDQIETVLGDAGATLHRYADRVVKYTRSTSSRTIARSSRRRTGRTSASSAPATSR